MDKEIPKKKIKDLILISSFILLLLIILLFSQHFNKYDHCIVFSSIINISIFIIALFSNANYLLCFAVYAFVLLCCAKSLSCFAV